ncbi:hypothetical protein D3C79_853590 [compost metagenome]
MTNEPKLAAGQRSYKQRAVADIEYRILHADLRRKRMSGLLRRELERRYSYECFKPLMRRYANIICAVAI